MAGLRDSDVGCRWYRVQGSGCRVQGSGYRVNVLAFRICKFSHLVKGVSDCACHLMSFVALDLCFFVDMNGKDVNICSNSKF